MRKSSQVPSAAELMYWFPPSEVNASGNAAITGGTPDRPIKRDARIGLGYRNWMDLDFGGDKSGRHYAYRYGKAAGSFSGDLIGVREEAPEGAAPLLTPVMEKGRPVGPMPTLAEIRSRFAGNLERLDHGHKRLSDALPYPVTVSDRLGRAEAQRFVRFTRTQGER